MMAPILCTLFISLVCVGGGFYCRWMGNKAIREKSIPLSWKQQLLFGKTHMTGEQAVFWGKVSVKSAWVFWFFGVIIGLVSLLLIGSTAVGMAGLGWASSRTPRPPTQREIMDIAKRGRRQPAAQNSNNNQKQNTSSSKVKANSNEPTFKTCNISLPSLKLKDFAPKKSKLAGTRSGSQAVPDYPIKRYMVGLVIASNDDRGTPAALMPVFQQGKDYTKGKFYGGRYYTTSKYQSLLAKPGYAVAGLIGYDFAGLVGIRLVCAKVTSSGQLDLGDSYETDLAGRDQGNAERIDLETEQMPFGIFVYSSGEKTRAVGLLSAPRSDGADAYCYGVRQWKSLGDKFSIRGSFQKADGDTVTLKTDSGKIVEVNLYDICNDDLHYLQDNGLIQ